MDKDETGKGRSPLVDRVIRYFDKEGYKVKHEKVAIEGHSGILRKFDLIIQKGRSEKGVWIRDWKRTIGVNIIIKLDCSSEDVGMSNPLIVGGKFSDHEKSYSNRRKVIFLTKTKIARSLR